MAITIEQEPPEHSPAYNELIFVASSNNTALAGFQYVFDIYEGAVLKTRHLIPARPQNGLGVFDARKYIEQTVGFDMDETNTSTIIKNVDSFTQYQVKIGEKTDASGLVPDLGISSILYAWNSVFDFLDFVDYNEADHLLLDSTKPFLTNAPTEQNIELNQYLWMYSALGTPASFAWLQIQRYDAAGAPVGGASNIANGLTGSTDRFLRSIAGTQNLETQFGAGYFTGVASYTVQAMNGAFVPISKLYTFTITTECRYPTHRIHFLNELGGFDAYNFTKVADRDRTNVRKTVRTLTGEIDGSNDFVNTKRDRGIRVTHTTIQEKLTLRSDWLDDAGIAWLQELVESPEIYLEDGGDLIALHPTKTSFRIEKETYKQLFNLTVTFDFAVKNFRQRY